ncbi:hypothetical protein QVD17_40219 [Tagetes erecta]|uniref:F-box domain-containing protein n=1 Tax=Tagetes erecta TaxID=13708 RepID=A0AAD8JRR3_TARER|nr:hypothetical protein QVD17_40219 [Tagetes erecta]
MSTYLPFDAQVEIIKRVFRVKSLIRFRSVSKQWKSLIDSSKFISHHNLNQPHPHHILVRYKCKPYNVASEYRYVSIVDDDSFPQHKFSPSVAPIVNQLNDDSFILCSSHGLVCLYGYSRDRKNMIVVWNPTIRKSVGIELSYKPDAVGFGVCPKTSNPKIVTITFLCEVDTVKWIGKVSTLGCGGWRSVSLDLPKSLKFKRSEAVVDGVIYWVASNDMSQDMIISFDLTSEEFGKVDVSDSLVRPRIKLSVFKHKESLVVVGYDDRALDCDAWMMKKSEGPKYLCTKLFSHKFWSIDGTAGIMGFRENGEPIRQRVYMPVSDDVDADLYITLEAYEPSTQRIKNLGFKEGYDYFMMTSYTETLFLVNHSESIIQ